MDSSTFSLEKATQLITPHFDSLPFRPLRELIANKSPEHVIDNITVKLTVWPRFITRPCNLDDEGMFKFFHVGFRKTYFRPHQLHGENCNFSFLDQTGLLLGRPYPGHDCFWYLVCIHYKSKGPGSIFFDSIRGGITHLENDFASEEHPIFQGYWDRFKRDVKFWARKSIKAREDHITNLRKLVSVCDE